MVEIKKQIELILLEIKTKKNEEFYKLANLYVELSKKLRTYEN